MTDTQRNYKISTMATKVTVNILRSSLKIFETVSHFCHSFAIACSHSSFCNLFSPFIFNLTLESARTFELDSPPPVFSLLQTRLSMQAELIFLNYHIQWVMTDFFKSLSYLVSQFKTSTVWLLLPFPDLSPATPEFPYSFSKDALCFPTCSCWLVIFPLPGMSSHRVAVFQHMLLRI